MTCRIIDLQCFQRSSLERKKWSHVWPAGVSGVTDFESRIVHVQMEKRIVVHHRFFGKIQGTNYIYFICTVVINQFTSWVFSEQPLIFYKADPQPSLLPDHETIHTSKCSSKKK